MLYVSNVPRASYKIAPLWDILKPLCNNNIQLFALNIWAHKGGYAINNLQTF